MHQFHGQMARDAQEGLRKILTLLHQARHDLRMKTIGPVNAAMGHGRVFDYFDEIRKIIEPAKQDLLFVDPYLDAEFVSRYLPHVTAGVSIRPGARTSTDASSCCGSVCSTVWRCSQCSLSTRIS